MAARISNPVEGAQVWMWKHYFSETPAGKYKSYIKLPDGYQSGPKDNLIDVNIEGMKPIEYNDLLDEDDTVESDAIHTYAVVRETINMFRRTLATPDVLDWHWNKTLHGRGQRKQLMLMPHGLPDVANAEYDRKTCSIRFGIFQAEGTDEDYYTCHSLDIVAHETGHAILDGLQPDWLSSDNEQTYALHESFGDLTAIFLTLSQLDQANAVIVEAKGDMHDRSYLAVLADQFQRALDHTRRDGLRNADNDLKISSVTEIITVTTRFGTIGTMLEPYKLSLVFTGAMYSILADIYKFMRNPTSNDASVLHQAGEFLRRLVVQAIIVSPQQDATFSDVAQNMLELVVKMKGLEPAYLKFIYNRCREREIDVDLETVMTCKEVRVMERDYSSTHVKQTPPRGLKENLPCRTLQRAMKYIL